jgi:hypothetical protein
MAVVASSFFINAAFYGSDGGTSVGIVGSKGVSSGMDPGSSGGKGGFSGAAGGSISGVFTAGGNSSGISGTSPGVRGVVDCVIIISIYVRNTLPTGDGRFILTVSVITTW